jgi:hypothetical protein
VGQGVGLVEDRFDVLDQEVDVVRDRVDVDFEEFCFERVDVRLKEINSEKIGVDKDEFGEADNTPEEKEGV